MHEASGNTSTIDVMPKVARNDTPVLTRTQVVEPIAHQGQLTDAQNDLDNQTEDLTTPPEQLELDPLPNLDDLDITMAESSEPQAQEAERASWPAHQDTGDQVSGTAQLTKPNLKKQSSGSERYWKR